MPYDPMTAANSPAQLGADNVIRFVDVAHFLRELAGNLGRGRAFVRTRRKFELRSLVDVQIEAPTIDRRVGGRAVVVFNRDGFLGLEFEDFEARLLPALDALGQAAEAQAAGRAAERTVIAPLNDLMPTSAPDPSLRRTSDFEIGGAQIHFDETDEGHAGSFARPLPRGATEVAPRPAAPVAHFDEADEVTRETSFMPLSLDSASYVGDLEVAHPSSVIPVRADPDAPTREEPVAVEVETPSRVAGIEALSDPRWVLPRMTPSGILRATDASDLLGLYLSQIRHGNLTVFGGPALTPGESAVIKVSVHRVVELKVTAIARVGEWLSLSVEQSESLRELLTEASDSWTPAIADVVRSYSGGTGDLRPVLSEPYEEDAQVTGRRDAGLQRGHDDQQATGPHDDARIGPGEGARLSPSDEDPGRHENVPLNNPQEDARVAGPHEDGWTARPRKDARNEGPRADAPIAAFVGTADALPRGVSGPLVPSEPTDETSSADERQPPGILRLPDLEDDELGPNDLPDSFAPMPEASTGDLVAAIVGGSGAEPSSAGTPENDESPAPEPPSPGPEAHPAEPVPSMPPAQPSSPIAAEKAALAPEPTPAPTATPEAEPGTAQPPRLEQDLVIFAHRDDLAQEMAANLQNGGLFVVSDPIEIRSKRRLRVRVGSDLLPVTLETDVVFSDGGRVGFSIANTPAAQKDLQRYLNGELPIDTPAPPPDANIPTTGGLNTKDVEDLNRDAVSSGDLMTFAGYLAPSPPDAELLRLQETRVEDPAQLGTVSVIHLFEYIVRQQWKGVLTINHGDLCRRIWMHEGSVAFIKSDPYEEATSLGRVLISLKKLTEVHLREGLEKSKQSHRSLGRTLVLLGVVKRTDITMALREQVRLKMDSSFGWSEGRYEWTPWTEPPGQADLVLTRGIGVMARHVRGRLDHLNISAIEALFGRSLSRRIAHAPDVDTVATSLQLTPRDLRFLELSVDGTKSVHDAVFGSPLGRLASLRLVALGLTLGFVHYTDDAPTPVARPSSHSGDESTVERRLRQQMQESLHLVQSQNHFERLGVHWSAHHRSYQAAYDKVAAELDLTKPPLANCSDEIRSLARQLRAVLEESYRALNDPQLRASYRKKLFDRTEREYAADMLVKQGEVALMRGDRMRAIECLETAVELSATPRNRALLTSARGGRS